MLHHSNLMGPKFWAEIVNIVAYIKARCLHKAMNGTWHLNKHGTGINLQWIVEGVWMCNVCTKTWWQRTKLDAKNTECVFVGYNVDSKAYKLIEESNGKLNISRDVVFNEVVKIGS
jgi:hypothetical protein